MTASLARLALFVVSTALAAFSISSHIAAQDLFVELCNKTDPSDRISGVLVERVKGQWTILSKNRRTTVYEAEYEPCPEAKRSQFPSQKPIEALPPIVAPPQSPSGDTEILSFEGSGTVGFGIIADVFMAYAKHIGASVKPLTSEADFRRGNSKGVFEMTFTNASKPALRVELTPNGSNNALPALLAGRAQIGMSSRPFTDGEVQSLIALGSKKTREEIERVIALDAIVLIVNARNPVDAISICDAAKLFSGAANSWKLPGGGEQSARAHVLTATSGTYDLLRDIFEQNCGLQVGQDAIPNATWAQLMASVASDPGGIGFAAQAVVNANVKSLRIRERCGIEQSPERLSIKTEDYPLSRRLFLYIPGSLQRQAQAFVDFITTEAGQQAVSGAQAIDQRIELARPAAKLQSGIRDVGLEEDPDSTRRFQHDTRGAERLSISYRFKSNSYELDTKANQDIARLAAYFQKRPTAGTIVIAGFTDAQGPARENRLLAQRRAEVVANALRSLGARLEAGRVEVHGYGEILPVACNSTDIGLAKNRRVEVWLRP